MIYLDTSALAKLVIEEKESNALEKWLSKRPTVARVSSDISRVELLRAVMRVEPTLLLEAQRVIARLTRVPITRELLTHASAVQPPEVRSLDAIHLTSALRISKQLTAFIAYDNRLLAAADKAGLPTVAPT